MAVGDVNEWFQKEIDAIGCSFTEAGPHKQQL